MTRVDISFVKYQESLQNKTSETTQQKDTSNNKITTQKQGKQNGTKRKQKSSGESVTKKVRQFMLTTTETKKL